MTRSPGEQHGGRRFPRRWRARRAPGAVVAVTLLLAAACTDGGGPAAEPAPARPVTVAESEQLANVRFRNFDAGSRKVTARYTEQSHEVRLQGWFDYTTHTGYGLVSADGRPSDRVAWNGRLVATSTGDRLGTPLRSLDGWQAGELDPASSPLAVVLTVLASLGSDRPENPMLIRQGGALWLREDTTGERAVTVFAGPTAAPKELDDDGSAGAAGSPAPSPAPTTGSVVDPDAAGIRYWVDRTGLAHRVDVRLGDRWAEVTLEHATVTVPPLLRDVELRETPDRSES